MKKINIALDGPAGAGKSTVARMVAKSLGFVYVDTGAMYRAVTWKVLKLGIQPEDVERVIAVAHQMVINLQPGEQGQLVFVDGENVTLAIRSDEINRNVSKIAQIAEVRQLLVSKQQQMSASKGVVMDGRDIGTHVLPNAEVKVFLTASSRERAERRFQEMTNPSMSLAQLQQDIELRDRMDEQRETAPLIRAKDAVLLDSTNMGLSEVIQTVLELCKTQLDGG